MSASGILSRFSTDFGVPFLLGRKCVIADPLGKQGFAAIKHGLDINIELKDACDAQFVEAAFFSDVTPATFDHDAATLLYAAHELFATTHPQADSFYARTSMFARAATAEVEGLPRSLDPSVLVTRHLIARRLFRTNRTDVHVKWWTGNASFYGEEPSKRLTLWPSLRRVQQQRLTQPMWRLALQGDDEQLREARKALLIAVLDASPLTRLLFAGDPVTKNLGFSLLLPWKLDGRKVSPLDVLEDRRLARAVVDSVLADGLDSGGSAIALALLQGLREGTSPLVLRRAAELCTHLALIACQIEGEAAGAAESKPLVAFIDGDPAALNEATRVYWAVVSATLALGRSGVLDVPSIDEQPPAVRDVFARLLRRLEHKRVVAVAEPLLRELGRRLPKAPRALASTPDVESVEPVESVESSGAVAAVAVLQNADLAAIADVADDVVAAEPPEDLGDGEVSEFVADNAPLREDETP